MKNLKYLVLALLLGAPMAANAAGMGVYIPVGLANSSSVEGDNYSYTVDTDYKPSAGIGLTFDTNIGKDRLFNYRLGAEYTKVAADSVTVNGVTFDGNNAFNRFNLVNTFGFGVLRKKAVRLWVGPRINLALNTYEDGPYSATALEFGIAPAVGVNVNLGPLVSLAFDADYRVAAVYGSWEFDNGLISDSDNFSGTAQGFTARFYVLFRFGEKF